MNVSIPIREYRIASPVYFILRDREPAHERLLFHIKTGDYFAMLATALGFIEEALENTETSIIPSAELMVLRNMKKDLLFLHTRYDIREKTNSTP
jgi:hypothetical protein